MASHTFRFTARWKEELVVVGPGGSFILELPMGDLTARLPTHEVWRTNAPRWAVDVWSVLRTELDQWCAANGADLEIDPSATVSAFYGTSQVRSGRAIPLILIVILAVVAAGAAYIHWSPVVAQDVCLDGGGRWEAGHCIGRRPNG
jgi:hypothetical protein